MRPKLINSLINFHEKISIKWFKIMIKYNINIHKIKKFPVTYYVYKGVVDSFAIFRTNTPHSAGMP